MTRMTRLAVAGLLATLGFAGCTSKLDSTVQNEAETTELRNLKPSEALSDFRTMAEYFRTLYGPMQYKEERFGFQFETWVNEIEGKIANAKTDAEIFGLFAEFITKFQDGHLSINFPLGSSLAKVYSIPVFLTPVEGKTLVANVDASLTTTKMEKGDEILTVDGKTPAEILALVLKYRRWATPESNEHLVYKVLSRDFFMTDLIPTKNAATIAFKKADGRVFTEEFIWKVIPWVPEKFVNDLRLNLSVPFVSEFQSAAGATLMSMAKSTPFFASPEVLKKYGMRVVTANEEYRKKYGLADNEKPDIYAALYKYQGKTILLVRSYTFHHDDLPNKTYLKGYKAILDQWEGLADVLVLDQTHNGGGSYCEDFFRLFIPEQKNGFVQALHVDRKWINDLKFTWIDDSTTGDKTPDDLKKAYMAMGALVEKAYDEGQTMTIPVPIMGGQNRVTPADYTWKKPMLVLVDELAGSCADAFPMLIKNNNVAKIFGKRTMGLGGNVEAFDLPITQTKFRMTRGLFTSFEPDGVYRSERFIENNGVTPDYPYEHTVQDFRAGFIEYVKSFSEKALQQ